MMSRSIRYFRQGKDGYAGVLMIPEMEVATHKARLEASGYVVLDNLFGPPVTAANNTRPEANGTSTLKCVPKMSN
jgi:hypothetical protein